jgi:hypothetical protein
MTNDPPLGSDESFVMVNQLALQSLHSAVLD